MSKYSVTINQQKLAIELNDSPTGLFANVEGKSYRLEQYPLGAGEMVLMLNGVPYTIDVEPSETGFRVHITGLDLIAEVMDERKDALSAIIGNRKQKTTPAGEVHSPMPGLIVKIEVQAGQTVRKGDPLIIIEAMKMENVITSPIDGTIQSIKREKGEVVNKNDLLVIVKAE